MTLLSLIGAAYAADEMIQPLVPVGTATGMTPDQQFYLALGALFLNMLVVILTYMKASSTHILVNSELQEFKKLLASEAARGASDARLQGIREGRDQRSVGPAGPQGEPGPMGPRGA